MNPKGVQRRIELSLLALNGLNGPKTMKFRGTLLQNQISILVDNGASHNFVSTRLVQQLNLQFSNIAPFLVKLGDGHSINLEVFVTIYS